MALTSLTWQPPHPTTYNSCWMRAVAAVVMAVVALGPKSRLFWVYGGTVPKASLVLMHIQNSLIFCNTDKRGHGGGYLCVGLLEKPPMVVTTSLPGVTAMWRCNPRQYLCLCPSAAETKVKGRAALQLVVHQDTMLLMNTTQLVLSNPGIYSHFGQCAWFVQRNVSGKLANHAGFPNPLQFPIGRKGVLDVLWVPWTYEPGIPVVMCLAHWNGNDLGAG